LFTEHMYSQSTVRNVSVSLEFPHSAQGSERFFRSQADKRTLNDVLEWAETTYGIPETEAKEIMKAGGMTSYKATDAQAVMTLISAGRTPLAV
jgi:hypothetical protein